MVLNWSCERIVASISRPVAGIDVVRQRREAELGAAGGGEEPALAGGLADAEAVRVADAAR